jgi:hypothetical protein
VVESFTVDTFAGRIGERFLVRLEPDETTELELVEASGVGPPPQSGQRTPFSLVFRGPADPVLPQRIYEFAHDELGALEIFIVPIGHDESGTSYEAVFS